MENAVFNLKMQNNNNRLFISKENTLIWVCCLFALLIIGRALSNLFFLLLAPIFLSVFLFCKIQVCIPALFFLLPSASILKYDVEDISLFTILFFLVVLKTFINVKEFDVKFIVCLLAFFGYNLIFSSFSQIFSIITISSGILMLYLLKNISIDYKYTIISYAIGICFASCLALLKSFLPVIQHFINDVAIKLGEGSYANRFSGLQGNPNYFTLDVIIVLSSLVVAYYLKPEKIYLFLFVLLSIFGIMSISKSFFISWVILIFIWFIISIKDNIINLFKFVGLFLIAFLLIYCVAYEYINAYVLRFAEDIGGSLASITTGRTEIWEKYIDKIFSDPVIFLFGAGVNSKVGDLGTHNTYLDCFYSFGVIGTILFILLLKKSFIDVIELKMIWVPISILLIRMIAIGILSYDNLWFYLILLLTIGKSCNIAKETQLNKS